MNLKPLHNNIIVKLDDVKTTTDSGIILPSVVTGTEPTQGVVLAAGPGTVQAAGSVKPLTVKANDKVLFHKKAGQELEVEGEPVIFMTEADILGVIV